MGYLLPFIQYDFATLQLLCLSINYFYLDIYQIGVPNTSFLIFCSIISAIVWMNLAMYLHWLSTFVICFCAQSTILSIASIVWVFHHLSINFCQWVEDHASNLQLRASQSAFQACLYSKESQRWDCKKQLLPNQCFILLAI